MNWTLVNDIIDSTDYPVDVMTFKDDTLFVGIEGRGIYKKIDNNHWYKYPGTTYGLIPTHMTALQKDVYIGTEGQYFIGKASSIGNLSLIFDSLDFNCNKSNSIRQMWVTKLLPASLEGSEVLLASNVVTNQFVLVISSSGINCFGTEGLSQEDIYYGAHDIAWKDDTLLAGTSGVVKKYVNNQWPVLGDSLPLTPQKFRPYATAIAVYGNRVFVGTNYVGVLEWKEGNGWNQVGDGLPRFSDGYYDAISYLVVFQGKLIAAYGSGKPWRSSGHGLYSNNLQ